MSLLYVGPYANPSFLVLDSRLIWTNQVTFGSGKSEPGSKQWPPSLDPFISFDNNFILNCG